MKRNHLTSGAAASELVSITSCLINRRHPSKTWNENWLPVILRSWHWQWVRSQSVWMSVCFRCCPVRLYPVGTTVQRYPIKDIVLQNYHIPAGVSLFSYLHTNVFECIQCYSWLQGFSTLPSDDGPGLSLPSGQECRGVWGPTELQPRAMEQQQRGGPERRQDGVSLPGIRVRSEAVCREEDRRERAAAPAHACVWQQAREGGWRERLSLGKRLGTI